MFKFVKGLWNNLTGKTASQQAKMAEAALASQRRQVEEESARLKSIEEGQRRVRGGGRRGLLAFIEDELAKTLGGAA